LTRYCICPHRLHGRKGIYGNIISNYFILYALRITGLVHFILLIIGIYLRHSIWKSGKHGQIAGFVVG